MGDDGADLPIDVSRIAGQRSVDGMDRRTVGQSEGRQADETGMIVDDVELVSPFEKREKVLQLPVALSNSLARCGLEGRDDRGFARRVARGEERYVDSCVHESVGEELDDGLDAAVAIGRYGEPDGTEDRYAHYRSFTAIFPFLTSTVQTRPSALTPSRRVPSSHSGAASGVELTRAPVIGSGRSPRSRVRQSTGAPAAHA